MLDQTTGQEQWGRIKRRLRAELGEDVFQNWISGVDWAGRSGATVRLSVSTLFLRNWVQSKYAPKILGLWRDEIGDVEGLEFFVRGGPRGGPKGPTTETALAPRAGAERTTTERPARPATDSRQIRVGEETRRGLDFGGEGEHTLTGSPLDPRFTFAHFIEGRSNAMALGAVKDVAATHPGEPVKFNPLYIHAAVGLGKTHLLQGLAHEAKKNGRRVLYLTAETFVYRFVQALKAQSALAFKEALRGIDLLVIDDMQFLHGKQVEKEFCHTLNSLIDGARQVVVAGDRPPAELETLDERLRSRLAGGLLVEIGAPDLDLRRAVLTHRFAQAAAKNPLVQVTDGLVSYVAANVTQNLRDLDGAVNRLVAHVQFTSAPPSIDMAEMVLKDLVRTREPKRILIEDIQRVVSKKYNVSKADLVSARRARAVVRPRQIAMYLAKTMTPRSLPEIGRRFGNRDHTTVLHAVRKIEDLARTSPEMADEIEAIKRMFDE